jgi:acetyltransferase
MIRPIRPEDEPLLVTFHETLSEQSVYMRYFAPMKLQQRTAHERLSKICFIDYDIEMVLVATRKNPDDPSETQIMAAGRLTKLHGKPEGEFGILVGDPYQGYGLGTELLKRLVVVGRDEGLTRIIGYILPTNRAMIHVAQEVGFEISHTGDGTVLAAINL